MAKALKVYTTGTTIVPIVLARMVGNNHALGQAVVYVSAPTKAAAYATLKSIGLAPSSPSHAGFRQAIGITTEVLADAGLFTEPTVLITHCNGIGPVVQTATGNGSVIIGAVVARNQVTRFVPATHTANQ